MERKVDKVFFSRDARVVANDLLGKILVRKFSNEKILKTRIVETEAYLGEKDPASWARFGLRKDNKSMWMKGGTVLIKNVHMYKMLNFVTNDEGTPEAVLIRALEPLNFSARLNGPGLLTREMKIEKTFDGKNIFDMKELNLIDDGFKDFEIGKSFRIGVVGEMGEKLRFFIKDNKFVSRK